MEVIYSSSDKDYDARNEKMWQAEIGKASICRGPGERYYETRWTRG